MKNLLDIGFPQLNWVVGSISDNVIKKMLNSAKENNTHFESIYGGPYNYKVSYH